MLRRALPIPAAASSSDGPPNTSMQTLWPMRFVSNPDSTPSPQSGLSSFAPGGHPERAHPGLLMEDFGDVTALFKHGHSQVVVFDGRGGAPLEFRAEHRSLIMHDRLTGRDCLDTFQ